MHVSLQDCGEKYQLRLVVEHLGASDARALVKGGVARAVVTFTIAIASTQLVYENV